jgi:DNA polymerase-3 subunit epsilon
MRGRSRRRPLPPGLAPVRARRLGRPIAPARFAVLDVETTGLRPDRDRVIEIGVVTTDPSGRVTEEWTALVDPGRDPGPTELHGITAEDLAGAPDFAAVAPELSARLDGAVVVAHNLAFDAAFLAAEQDRAGRDLLGAADGGLCTLELSRRLLPRSTEGWSLTALCAGLDVDLVGPHRALVDARATAGVLAVLLDDLPAGRAPMLARRLTRGR